MPLSHIWRRLSVLLVATLTLAGCASTVTMGQFDRSEDIRTLGYSDQRKLARDSSGALFAAYRKKFGFPLIIAVRENTKETILRSGNARLDNSPSAEQATALVEIAKIANLRLLDIVEEPDSEPLVKSS